MKHAQEVEAGERFEFGKNWTRFLSTLNDQRIERAEVSLARMLRADSLRGLTFLDIGCGSGLFSLAARRMGARVHSLDFDPHSVACAAELRRRYFPDDENWIVEPGSALDRAYIESLGRFDIVYSWGVLHHTGKMWEALANAALPVALGGLLFVSIYNDQGKISQRWTAVKRFYNHSSRPVRFLLACGVSVQQWWTRVLGDFLRFRPFATWKQYGQDRGMSPWYDVIDWVGGYPFEVAKPEEIFDFYHQRGFSLIKMTTCGGTLACNELVFRKTGPIEAV